VKMAEQDYLAHYGILRKSGRYPWGSGETQSTRNRMFLDTVAELREQGLSDPEIARGFSTPEHKFNTSDLRALTSIARNQQRQEKINHAQKLKDKGMSPSAIGREMGINESSVRTLLAPGAAQKASVIQNTAEMLKRQVEDKTLVDIGTGAELSVGVSPDRFKTAVAQLKEEGYRVHYIKVRQLGTGLDTTQIVLAPGHLTSKEVFARRGEVRQIQESTQDHGSSFLGVKPPLQISASRIKVRWAEEGGTDADGVIYVRPGVKDLSIGSNRYGQVRIAVEGTHYLKGMAIYKDDLPAGVDLVFNTNKKRSNNPLDAMKPLKDEPDNPFGAVIKQFTDEKGNLTSAMNIVSSKEGMGLEGGWETWKKSLASQVLSKQSPELAKQQLDMMLERKRAEFEEISKLTNPSVKKRLLESLAEDTDAAGNKLVAAALPGQATHVLLPVPSMKPTEVYAPKYDNGDRVALVRYPHAGTFEIPELTVNNRHKPAIDLLGNARDAIGIHPDVAERLSGADFDGDTVLVIPNNKGQIKSTPALEGLKNFDPKRSYPQYEGMTLIDAVKGRDQQEMGYVTNLISDMTLQGASTGELARAVRHSMVIIDAKKHKLDWQASARDNGIPSLMQKYQGRKAGGASTLITRATSRIDVAERKQGFQIDPSTGRKIFRETGAEFENKKGKLVRKTTKSTKLAEVDDAHSLSSGTVMEGVYADHANRMKALANDIRKASTTVTPMRKTSSAARVYSAEVASLNAKLTLAKQNAPLERQAQVLANAVVREKRAANPNLEPSDIKKIENQAQAEMRLRTGARKQRIELTDREWEAIQAGALAPTKLNQILNNSDLDRVKELATPRAAKVMTGAKKTRARAMLANGYTQAEVAKQLGVSVSTLTTNVDIGGE